MPDRPRRSRPALTRSSARAAAAGALALAAVAVPGSTAPAHAAAAVVYRVEAGTVLHPLPPRFVLPVRGYRLTGRFGDSSSHWRTVHTGLDFAAPSGTPIRSIATGVVVETGYDGRYGNKTVLRLSDGTELWFCHQSSVDVRPGQWVRPGQRIGTLGATGNVTGPHLHLEVRPDPGRPVDPDAWLRVRGLQP